LAIASIFARTVAGPSLLNVRTVPVMPVLTWSNPSARSRSAMSAAVRVSR